MVEHREDGAVVSEATVKVRVRGERVIATAEGNGPVNALDEALRVALSRHYPELTRFELADYKVRILEGSHGTGAVTRVLVETTDGTARDWTTVGVHENVVEASWHALVDALTLRPGPHHHPRLNSPSRSWRPLTPPSPLGRGGRSPRRLRSVAEGRSPSADLGVVVALSRLMVAIRANHNSKIGEVRSHGAVA